MPRLSVWAVRLALIHLVAGWAVGALMMTNRAWGLSAGLWQLLDLHVALALFGWTFQLVIGVAYRMLPTFGRDRGRPKSAWTSLVAVNAGVAWVALGLVADWAIVLVAPLAWLVATIAFAWHLWPRVKPFGSRREGR